jgi:ubiquinone biosynthesis protein
VVKPFTLLRDAGRMREILAVLVKYGFSNLLEQVGVPGRLVRVVTSREVAAMSTWQRLRHAIEELGPTFVKIGQVLSTRPDRVPDELVHELEQLRDQVRPEPFANVLAVLRHELGREVEDVFATIDEVPIGSGSIAQVHRAVLKDGGDVVAVKVQRPGVERDIQADLDILAWLAREVHDRIAGMRPYNLPQIAEVLRESLLVELDFTNEARNAELFNARNPHAPHVFAPKVYDAFSTKRLIVTELVVGSPPDKVDLSPAKARELARMGADSVFNQIINSGFFHADPHPGNIIVTPDGRICFIDWGYAGQLTRKMRHRLAELIDAIVHMDAERVARVAVSMNELGRRPDEEELELRLTKVFNRHGASFRLSQLGHIIVEMIYALGLGGVRIPRAYTMLARAVVCIENTGRKLDPDFDIGAAARPFMLELARERRRPRNIARNIAWTLAGSLQKLNELPSDMQRIVRRIEREDLGINLHHKDLEPFGNDIQRSANRLSIAIILGSAVIGSSIVMTIGMQPLIWGYPAIGLAGYLFSGILGMWVVLDIMRHGRHK